MSLVMEQTAGPSTTHRESVARQNRRRLLVGGTLLVGGALAMMAIPVFGASGYAVTLAYYAAFYVGLGQSWNLMSGLTGYLSVAHAAFLGIGAYTAVLLMNAGQHPVVAMAAAVTVSGVAAFLVGLPSLRVSGLAFAFTTLFFLEICRLTVTLWTPVTGGGAGVYATRLFDANHMYYLMVGAALLTTLVVLVVRHSQVGRELVAIREDEEAAESIGINATKLKLITFTASGALAGFVGAVHGAFLGYLLPISVFALELTLIAIALPLINGTIGVVLASLIGLDPAVAAILGILCASASYIAVPAAMRLALPEADPGVYLSMSLGITFPFNVIVGIPLFAALARLLG